jgi:shikimate kinase / 3-dehydroquinate synthase
VHEKSLAEAWRIWSELQIGRDGTIVAYGGGTTTDLAGFVAATYMRGVRWIALPTTLVGQVDAAIGGKTAVDLPQGKNLVGAFHYPDRVVIDPDELATLADEERRNGMAEVVKTGLLAGQALWELPEREMIRACAAFKAAVCLQDPYERKGRREILNLGHTFGHALESASEYRLPHGEAVALGLKAALKVSGVEADLQLDVHPVRVDRERAWQALQRDKKARNGKIRLVLLEELGKPVVREVDPGEVRTALDELIAD